MNVLVTGGAGYIGSHTVHELVKSKFNVVVYDNLSKGHVSAVPVGIELVQGDICDSNLLAAVIKEKEIEAVIHFAADSLVGESMQAPAKYYHNNVVGTLALLDVMRIYGVDKIVFSSTAAVYGEPAIWPITEDMPTVPINVYGRTKLIIEGILSDFGMSYGLNYVSLRYFNAAGAQLGGTLGEDHTPETHLIPRILKSTLGQLESVSIYGTDYDTVDGTCIRDYIHVSDLAVGHVLALEHLIAGGKSEVYNLGSGAGFSVRQIIEKAQDVTGVNFVVREMPRRVGDPAVLVASAAKICTDLNWVHRYSDLETIVNSAWQWHKNHPKGYL